MNNPKRRRKSNCTPEIEVPFSGFTPLNTSSSPPGGANHVKYNDKEQHTTTESTTTSSNHNVFLARHLGLGTDQIATPLATLDHNAATGRKRKSSTVKAKSNRLKKEIVHNDKQRTDVRRGVVLGGSFTDDARQWKRTKRENMLMQEFFPESKVKDGDFLSKEESVTVSSALPFSKPVSEQFVQNGFVQPDSLQKGADDAFELPLDFDSDELLSDTDLRCLLDQAPNDYVESQAAGADDEIDHVTDSVGGDDEELFRSFINFPPVDSADEQFDQDDLQDEDLVGALDSSVESQQKVEEVEFDGLWLDELDEAVVELLTPCSMPQ